MKISKEEFLKLYNIACGDWQKKFNNKFKDQIFSDGLDFDDAFLLEMQKACTDPQLVVFKQIFKGFIKASVMDRVQGLSDIYKELGQSRESIVRYANPISKEEKSQNALALMQSISKVYNEGEEIDFSNPKQRKYYNWFQRNADGRWVLCVVCYYYGCAFAPFGCYFASEEKARDVAKKFDEVYQDLLP